MSFKDKTVVVARALPKVVVRRLSAMALLTTLLLAGGAAVAESMFLRPWAAGILP